MPLQHCLTGVTCRIASNLLHERWQHQTISRMTVSVRAIFIVVLAAAVLIGGYSAYRYAFGTGPPQLPTIQHFVQDTATQEVSPAGEEGDEAPVIVSGAATGQAYVDEDEDDGSE